MIHFQILSEYFRTVRSFVSDEKGVSPRDKSPVLFLKSSTINGQFFFFMCEVSNYAMTASQEEGRLTGKVNMM